MTAELTLDDGRTVKMDGRRWTSADRVLQAYVRSMFPLTSSPADGSPGSKQVAQAAKRLNAEVRWIGAQPEVTDRVY